MKEMNESWDAKTSNKIKENNELKKKAAIANAIKRRDYERKRKEMFGDE
jgi:hypothetical protein